MAADDSTVNVDVEVEVEVDSDELEIELGDKRVANARLEADGVDIRITAEIARSEEEKAE
ncbi:hypothetical protein ACNS7O_03105 [Haloferacaceae archaeon DSL9]